MPGPADGLWSIGELAERAGVTVKTVRFYSDRGLLPETARSAGGHRRYGSGALDRLRLIRSLRALDLPLPEVRRVLEDEAGDGGAGTVLEDAVAARLGGLGRQLAALRWQEAGLRLVRDCPPRERADRLRLIAAVAAPPSTDAPARFWRAWLPPRMPARAVSAFLEHAVPQPPADPVPAQVLAFARLHALVTGPCPAARPCQPAVHGADARSRAAVLYAGLAEAYGLAADPLRSGRAPQAGAALDCFAAAYAAAYGTGDGTAFRRRLRDRLAADPRFDRYWELVAEVAGPRDGRPAVTPGTAHDWLLAALDADVERAA
ncbi:MerR family transcriptional regulator [Streptomyces globosus]|uniref:MerR family transcriptional regulator n=1 Tax=Streptomyces sp. WAC05292 TaxID=2487418 RepID=UPI000F749393|nr:MerR family transcriptional regulator [Streptomyces sp. WAC05292]RSS94226.1 MerR family transcriptional regulator [Streptomyces sp. WAC05292]